MDIAAISTIISQGKIQQQAGLSVMNMVKNTSETQSVEITRMMEQSVNSHMGRSLDIKL